MPDLLSPPEAWDAADEQIDVWQEDQAQMRRDYWRAFR